MLAALATPLVLSVHSIVSTDFATSLVPGWHTTIFPPYFVAGAIYSGFGMVLTLLIITRQTMHLERYITVNHLEAMAKVTLLTGSLVGYAYATEFFNAWYSGNVHERFHFINRATGPLRVVLLPDGAVQRADAAGAVVEARAPQRRRCCSWSRSWSTSACGSNASSSSWSGCTATSCRRRWGMFYPTVFDIGILVGVFGLFFSLFLLFIRALPMIAMWEVKGVSNG